MCHHAPPRYYGLMSQRFCYINRSYQEIFEDCFVKQYQLIHRLETNKLRNVAKLFAHLLHTDSLPWHVLAGVRLTADDTTPSSRIFIKVLVMELAEYMGLGRLRARMLARESSEAMAGLLPRDNVRHTRFSINFFTSIGLGALTDDLRAFLKAHSAAAASSLAAALS